ncbi:MAG: hypothetical protein GX957_03725 [Clostridiaceae bacterium]|nr:hypothetical protein [Clostridiaceae bacterium]
MEDIKYRFAICGKCKKKWNISRFQHIPKGGYICPHCLYKRKQTRKICKYIMLFIAGILLYSISADVAYIQRGYKSIGGEALILLLPLGWYLAEAMIKGNLKRMRK